MAIDSFLKLGTLKGEAVVKGFEDQMQLMSWGWGMTQTGTTHSASGGGAGKVDVQDLQITKNIDAASPTLALSCPEKRSSREMESELKPLSAARKSQSCRSRRSVRPCWPVARELSSASY